MDMRAPRGPPGEIVAKHTIGARTTASAPSERPASPGPPALGVHSGTKPANGPLGPRLRGREHIIPALEESNVPCPLCGVPCPQRSLREAAWAARAVEARFLALQPSWRHGDGACPSCLQRALLETLLEKGDAAFHHAVQSVWPLDAAAAFGALPTPLRLHADPRFTGRGITLAVVDAAFYPHPDLVTPDNRIRAWADASEVPVVARRFRRDEIPAWPGWDAGHQDQWHGLMTSVSAAGNGVLSHGLYSGIASGADLVLVQVRNHGGRIDNDVIARALHWLLEFGPELGIRVVSLSLGGEAVSPLAGNPVDAAVAALVARNVTVVVAAGNDGVRRLVPPATAPLGLTVGGLDDKNGFDHEAVELWHSNYGETPGGAPKPELVAPSIWVVAPILPIGALAREAAELFESRARGEENAELRIDALKLVTPHYQHVEGTSFAAPLVASVVAAMLEANPALTPRRIRELLVAAAHPVAGAPPERQGAGALDAGRAVTMALADRHSRAADYVRSPVVTTEGTRIILHDHHATEVRVVGSWDGWAHPGVAASVVEPGLWEVRVRSLPPGVYQYKFLLDGHRWLTDPANPARAVDGHGGWNSVFVQDALAL